MVDKRWKIAEPVSQEIKDRFAEVDSVVLQLLINRGLDSQEAIDEFMNPDYGADIHDPFLFQNMQVAVDRVYQALEKGERIVVFGDYDADGVTGSTILVGTLRDIARKMGADENLLGVYIPHREKEGYGLNNDAVDYLHKEKTNLIITVDCGVSNTDEITKAHDLGIDVIITDHHQMPEKLTQEAILIHPLVPGETYPGKNLSGAAVGYKLACGLLIEARKRDLDFVEGYEKWLLDLVAISLVTDFIPLVGEARTLEKYGLVVLEKTKRLGLKKLFEVAGVKQNNISTQTIGFQIGPRINAAGRMDHANSAYELLMSENESEAEQLAELINQQNIDRQKRSNKMYFHAKELVGEIEGKKILIAVHEGWLAGLVGLVAGKLLNEFNLPVLIITKEGDKYMGSGRSIEEFDITKALHGAEKYLDRFGGHPQACGFSLNGEENLKGFSEKMTATAEKELAGLDLTPSVRVDLEISLEKIDWQFWAEIDKFSPFGEANPEPRFVSSQLQILSAEIIGKNNQHMRLTVNPPDGSVCKMIAFNMADWAMELKTGDRIDVVYELGVSEWQGQRQFEFRVVDLKRSKEIN